MNFGQWQFSMCSVVGVKEVGGKSDEGSFARKGN